MQDYVETEEHEQIHKDQDAFIEAEVKSAKVESDEDQAPVSAKVALKCCQLLRLKFERSYRDTRIFQSDFDKMSSVIRKYPETRAKQLDTPARDCAASSAFTSVACKEKSIVDFING